MLFVWGAVDGNLRMVCELQAGSRGITACCFSSDREYVACCDISDEHHNLYIISVRTGKILNKTKTGGYKIMDVEWHS